MMMLVRVLDDGYSVYNMYGKALFNSEQHHESLLRFLDSDCKQVTALLKAYFQSIVDPNTLELITGKKPLESALNKAKKALRSLHPVFKHDDIYLAIPSMLANHLNLSILYRKIDADVVTPEWYGERLQPLVAKILADSYRASKDGVMNPMNLELDYTRFEQEYYKKYLDAKELGNWQTSFAIGLKMVENVQKKINQQIYWMVDASARHFNHMTFDQRARLYRSIFDFDNTLADLKIVRRLSFSDPGQAKTNPVVKTMDIYNRIYMATDDNEIYSLLEELEWESHGNDNKKELRKIFAQLTDNNVQLDQELTLELNREIQKAMNDSQPALFEEYEVENLYQLLLLELEQIVRSKDIVKRCRNCNRLYITGNLNIEYCNRIAPDEEVPCSEIGSKRAFDRKLEEEYPLRIYNRAYKTHYARKMKGNMASGDFEIWRDEAKAMLEQVRAGELDSAEFEQWLKV